MENNEKLMKIYNLAEIAYEKKFKDNGILENELYPDEWNQIKNYKDKIEIIGKAIKTNNLIINTPEYQVLIENIKNKIYKR